jgi:hypothetical protein
MDSNSLPKILGRVAYPVESFGFMLIEHDLLPPLPGRIRDDLWQQEGLFEQLDDGKANEFQCMHRWKQ